MSITNKKELHLRPWMEAVGKLCGIFIDDNFINLEIYDKVLQFPKEFEEETFIQKMLDKSFVGRNIAILRTDIQDKAILIRLLD